MDCEDSKEDAERNLDIVQINSLMAEINFCLGYE